MSKVEVNFTKILLKFVLSFQKILEMFNNLRKFFKIFLRILADKKFLDVIILLIIWFLKFILISRFRLVFLPTTLASLPPGVMLLNRYTAPRDSATNIEKTAQKGAREREQPNRSVVKKIYVM